MKVLFFVDRKFSCDHVFLEQVYSKILPKKGYEVFFVMKSNNGLKTGISRVNRACMVPWNDAKVYLLPSNSCNIVGEYVSEYFALKKLNQIFARERFDIVQARNEPVMARFACINSRDISTPI